MYPAHFCFKDGQQVSVARSLPHLGDHVEMHDIAQRSKELKLVFSVDNIGNQPSFICHCCGCCCGILDGINKHGYPNAIVSSTLVPRVDMADCNGCQKCARACHISAITLIPEPKKTTRKRMFLPVTDEDTCIGCGQIRRGGRRGVVKI